MMDASADITAVVLSARDYCPAIPGVTVLAHRSIFKDVAGSLDARLAALERVRTPWFFFLDDDDELPGDYPAILARCMDTDAALSYTRERVIDSVSGQTYESFGAPYTPELHVQRPMLLHHLVVCRTQAAREAAARIPRGIYCLEHLLFFEVAKRGANYVDAIGYIWHRGTGLSRQPKSALGQMRSMMHAQRQIDAAHRAPDSHGGAQ
jgi:hypothetical protein